MGVGVPNVYLLIHASQGAIQGYALRAHQTSISLESTSDECSPSAYQDVWDAVNGGASDAVLNTVGIAAWGQWWTAYISGTSGARAEVRTAVAAAKRA